jgi:hypothetical protein
LKDREFVTCESSEKVRFRDGILQPAGDGREEKVSDGVP